MKRRVILFVIVLLLIISTLPATALAADFPDLTVTYVNLTGDSIIFKIKNDGAVETGKGVVFYTSLSIDGKQVEEAVNTDTIAPGQEVQAAFSYKFAGRHQVTVMVDNRQEVSESNEKNNYYDTILGKEPPSTPPPTPSPTPSPTPQIIQPENESLPDLIVTEITPDKATGIVGYTIKNVGKGTAKAGHITELLANKEKASEDIIGKDLAPGDIYQSVFSGYNLSNEVVSLIVITDEGSAIAETDENNNYLEILVEQETVPIGLFVPAQLAGTVPIIYNPPAGAILDRVIFRLDNGDTYTDYSDPFVWSLDTTVIADGSHLISARTVNTNGTPEDSDIQTQVLNPRNVIEGALSPVIVDITSPSDERSFYEPFSVMTNVDNRYRYATSHIELSIDGILVSQQDFSPAMRYLPSPFDGHQQFTLDTNSASMSIGAHRLTVRVRDERGNWGSDSITFNQIAVPAASIQITRQVIRYNNYFEVFLSITNNGGADLRNVQIEDYNSQYQATFGLYPPSSPEVTRAVIERNPRANSESLVKVDLGDLPRRNSKYIRYYAVPIMDGQAGLPMEPTLGYDFIVKYTATAGEVTQHPLLSWSNSAEYNAALRSADYLIVTSPDRLFEGDQPFQLMADLAIEENGALGYLQYYSTYTSQSPEWLKDVITEGGRWSSRLAPGWARNGYMLLVGRNDVVQSYTVSTDRCWQGESTDITIHNSDQNYADTSGADRLPDIRIGRLISNSVTLELRNLLSYCRREAGATTWSNRAVVVSGPNHADSDGFCTSATNVVNALRGKGFTTSFLNSGATVDSTRPGLFLSMAVGADIIYWGGHGNVNIWESIIGPAEYGSLSFGTTHPIILANSCLTGKYTAGDNIAKTMIDKGAAVYIGSTEDSPNGVNGRFGSNFFNSYYDPSHRIGDDFTRFERDKIQIGPGLFESIVYDWSYEQIYVYEYNLYGDPKYTR